MAMKNMEKKGLAGFRAGRMMVESDQNDIECTFCTLKKKVHFFAKYKGEFKKDYYSTIALITKFSGT